MRVCVCFVYWIYSIQFSYESRSSPLFFEGRMELGLDMSVCPLVLFFGRGKGEGGYCWVGRKVG